MAKPVSMVIVNGVRYRPEDAPDQAQVETKQTEPKNKSRKPGNKSATVSEQK